MKRLLIPSSLFLLTVVLSGSALAKTKSTEIELVKPAQVSGTTLQPGTYKVTLNPDGNTTSVVFSQNGKQVASVTGQIIQLGKKASASSVTLDNTGSVPQVAEIDIEGQPTAVRFSPAAATANAGE